MTDFVNLHTHTVYSMLDGFGKVDHYVERAKRIGMPALAVTDHGNIHAWMDFYQAANKAGIKPILGIEAYQARVDRFNMSDVELAGRATDELDQRGPYHLTVLARNRTGYHNLIKLSSRSFTEGFYRKPRIDHELIAEHADGLIVLSGCLNGEVAQAIMRDDFDAALAAAARMQDIVGREHYFIEIMDHRIPEERHVLPYLREIAKKIGAPVVPTGDCHYVELSDSPKHDIYLAVATNSKVADEDRFKFAADEFYLKSYEDMLERFPVEEVVNSLLVADQVEDYGLDFQNHYFPEFPIPENTTIDEYLEDEVWKGVVRRYGEDYGDDVRERVVYELRVVRQMGFQSYFLVVADLVNWAKNNDVRTGWGRGSAAGSILSYVLGITNLDPLRFGLMFERFLVEGRKSMPDIDLDFDDRHRERVIDYARRFYGEGNVANIATFSSMGARSSIRDTARVLGYDYEAGNKVAQLVPPPVLGVAKTIKESRQTDEYSKAYKADADVREITDNAEALEGLVRQSGMHAAGVVITQKPVIEYVPIMQTKKKAGPGPVITQWDMNWVEANGLLKVDFLGLRNLGVIDMCLKTLKANKGIDIDIDDIPIDDHKTFAALRAGYSQGVFQLESSGMRAMMMALSPTSIEDIMALIALYRPGPLGSGMDKLFIARKHGRASDASRHPMLDELLSDTYGVMLYQENVLKVAREMAGFSPGEADDLRKAIGKKQMDKIPLFRAKFVEGCVATSGIPTDVADRIFTDIEYHGGYSFNLAHSASYAMVSYVTAYLKTNYPVEYMAALLTSSGNKAKAAPYLNECRRLNISVLPPSINRSHAAFSVEDDSTILFGLESIDGIGEAVVEAIMSTRTTGYANLYDFMRRCHNDVLNKATLEHLTRSGALDELIPEQPNRVLGRDEKSELLDIEKSELGLYVSEHPLTGVWHVLSESITTHIVDLDDIPADSFVKIGGILTNVTKRTTKAGKTMFTTVLEDLTGEVEVVVFPAKVEEFFAEEGDIVLIQGRLQKEGEEGDGASYARVFFFSMSRPDLPAYTTNSPVTLSYSEMPSYEHLLAVRSLIDANRGNTPVQVEYLADGMVFTLQYDTMISPSACDRLTELRNQYVV